MIDGATHTCEAWHVLEIADDKGRRPAHLIGVQFNRAATLAPLSASGMLTAKVYALAGDLAQRNHPRLLGIFGGHYVRQPGSEAAQFVLTGGNMYLDADARGLHIGTYVQNEVVRWAIDQQLPGTIAPITLISGDATTAEDRDRRNRFYEQFGITFDWQPPVKGISRAAGSSPPSLSIASLRTLASVKGIRAFDYSQALLMLAQRMSHAEATAAEAVEAHAQARNWYQQNLATERRTRRIVLAVAILLAMAFGYALGHIGYYAK